jgi:hypothetical protein
MKNTYKFYVRKKKLFQKGSDKLRALDRDRRITLKWVLQIYV